jgi:hypothetical protein
MLLRCLSGIVGRSSADDVLQDVLITLCRKLGALDAPELFRPWAYRTATRAVIFCILAVCVFVSRVTKKILKAIELSSKSKRIAVNQRMS